jgi:hypothetical protein
MRKREIEKSEGKKSFTSFVLICVFFVVIAISCEKATTYFTSDEHAANPPDVTSPVINSVFPLSNSVSVPVGSTVSITFSEPLNSTTINSSTITLKQGSTLIAGTISINGAVVVFTPASVLSAGKLFTGNVTTGVQDSSGNGLESAFSWSFTTSSAPDTQAPTVKTVSPAANAADVAVNTALTVTFSETMNATTITGTTFTLKTGTTSVAGSVISSGTTATFTPATVLAASTVYTATITTAAKDAAGNALASQYTWSFTTAANAPAGKSFSADVMPILNLCNTCHKHGWTTSTNASAFYNNLVSAGYIKPTALTTSKIYTKLSGGHPSSTVTTAQKNTVLTWITEGAKNN